MAIRNIRIEGDPILRKISKSVKEITQRTDELIDDMIESLGQLNGVRLAAVQVGVLKRICIICMDADDLRENEDEKIYSYSFGGGCAFGNGVLFFSSR